MVSKKRKRNSSTVTKTTDPPKPNISKSYPISKKPEQKKKPSVYHAVGVMQTEQESKTPYSSGMSHRVSQEQLQSHIPQYNVVPYSNDKGPKPLSASQIQSFKKKSKKNVFFP